MIRATKKSQSRLIVYNYFYLSIALLVPPDNNANRPNATFRVVAKAPAPAIS